MPLLSWHPSARTAGKLTFCARARQPDFLTPYLRYGSRSIGIHSVQFLLLQGLVMGDATVAEALDAARVQLTCDAVSALLAAQAAGTRAWRRVRAASSV